MSGVQQIEIRQEDADQRLDRWFKRHFPALGHGRLEKLLRTLSEEGAQFVTLEQAAHAYDSKYPFAG